MTIDNLLLKYPQLKNLRNLVSDDFILEEIGSKVNKFEAYLEAAKSRISTFNLDQVFSKDLERGSILLENFLGHWGNVSIEELCKICLIVKYIKPTRVLEIGTYNGMTTLQIALNAPKACTTYTLDLPIEATQDIELSKLDSLVAKKFKDQFGTETGIYFKGRTELNIVQLFGDSATFKYEDLGDEKFDIIFIDAAHDYENKKIDSENALKLISKGGVIIWHDYNQVTNPEVTQYLADFSISHNVYHLRNTSLAVYVHNS